MRGAAIRVRGQVQGVGFRPFVWQLAQRLGLSGWVLNDPEGVLIQAWGAGVEALVAALRNEAPPLARIDAVEIRPLEGPAPEGFTIAASQGVGAQTRVTPDAATCAECLAEIMDPADRRYRYPFANCTHCGPRFTIVEGLPYDRAKTTMAAFPMCPACQAEYENPADRRFHAQPVACAACGPRLWMEPETEGDVIAAAAQRLRAGEILAIKGLGGFHLACDATNAAAIETLRIRKRRPSKPLALMAPMAMLQSYAAPNDAESALLSDPAAPIVLLEKRDVALPDGLAPGQATLGWMLPYTPLHHLLCAAVGRPLVMTSGNLSGEPQVIGNDEAREKLAGFADAFLLHDREIARRLDDSVERITSEGPMVLRRARGRVPGTLPLPEGFEDTPQIIAMGGQMKGALCLIKNGQALLGHHLGEMEDALTWDAFRQAERDYTAFFDHRPEAVAVDLHPDFRPSRHGAARAAALDVPLIEVQHHHAHLAACLAENLWPRDGGKVAGIILDGTGLGPDGTVWGGEVLLGDYESFARRAWLKPAPLVGGDKAAQEPWRNALVRLDAAGLSDWADALFSEAPRDILRMAAATGVNAPLSSSAGRLFDAVAAVLGVCPMVQSFEGEAAMRLEALAGQAQTRAQMIALEADGPEINPAPLFHAVKGQSAEAGAALFHASLAAAFAQRARALVESGEAEAVALSGGCFQNARLLSEVVRCLGDLPVLLHHKTPANDGGLALGQALVAATKCAGGAESR